MTERAHPAVPPSLPHDGRFGSGPSRVRAEQVTALAAAPLGTSHRAEPVRSLVGEVRERLADLLNLPPGHEVVLGNGGASLVWEALTFSFTRERASHAVCGEFGAKFAALSAAAPFLADPIVRRAAPGSAVRVSFDDDADTLAFVHNETSTGVYTPLDVAGARAPGQLVVADGTSIAGASDADIGATDVYYFSPQKALGADGGLWLAALSPAAIERIEQVRATRFVPPMLDLGLAVAASRKNQTYNTPAIATLALLAEQLRWLHARGGLAAAAAHCRALSSAVYDWAQRHPKATPFVADPQSRSPVVATIDLAGVDAQWVRAELAARAGIVDIAPYRSLGRNQVRVGLFPSVTTGDVQALLAWLDWALAH